MRRYAPIAALILLPVLAGPASGQAQDEEGFTPLVEGTDPGQFQLVGIDAETISIGEDGVVSLTGEPNGYFATKDSYGDYVLRFDWMYERPEDLEDPSEFRGNSGLLVHIQGEHKVWPQCVEVQLQNRDAGHIFAIQGAQFTSARTDEQRRELQRSAILPPGEWNSEEVTCRGDRITCVLNDVEIDTGEGAEPSSGQIGWQSEGRPIKFRNLRIKPLD